ncbi:histidine kinase N-terminal domain-containing protein [Priestia abyssalis]|uniref:histidine kinase N-terminal domain-containing protein n=1 Tax=Priestia abyssalis TaxID=1221450 RepID=UPI000995424B|nr:histidine kinase N-terminal domain-containing protein [Priestia abyssalis]
MKAASHNLITFLESNSVTFLESWRQQVMISSNDIHKEEVMSNGVQMLELIRKNIEKPLSEEEIRKLAYKVAHERVEANINIGEFVYNVNLGRSEIMKWVNGSGLPMEQLQSIIEDINFLFDRFSYHAVTKYTEIKDEQLQEKISFIDQTHKERLAILGQMSSSFVHEFRNPLTSILGFSKLIKNEYPDIKYMDIILQELNQLNYRITQFLHVSKKEVNLGEKDSHSLEELFHELLEFIYPSMIDGDVQISLNVKPDIRIYANKNEIRQVFLNIILNSIDALQQIRHNREINIDCQVLSERVEIKITNNGPAIPKETIHTIFEPFFTTKELGTGIGLYVCKKIIEKHHGEIGCTSDNRFTTFCITLPLLL